MVPGAGVGRPTIPIARLFWRVGANVPGASTIPTILPPIYADGYSDASTAVGADGCYPVPTGPGLGVALDWDFIERRRTGYHRFGA